MKRIRKKLASRVKIVLKREKFSKKKCANCGKILQGVLNLSPAKMRNVAKTKKRPSRSYGGFLCSSCSSQKIIGEARR